MQTPSTGLRHPPVEEGAGKRCSECGVDAVEGQFQCRHNTKAGKPMQGFSGSSPENKSGGLKSESHSSQGISTLVMRG